MRIISAFVVWRIIIALLLPQVVLAAEVFQSNETKTNLKIEEKIANYPIIDQQNTVMLALMDNNSEGFLLGKKPQETKREKYLAKFQKRAKRITVPQKKFIINASAYTAAADECGKSDGITASGLLVKENETVACPSYLPFGTKLQIAGLGTYICEDRGGAIKGNHIDIYMKTKSQAFAFGRQRLLAEIVN